MIRGQALKLGFEELPHYTVGNSLVYDLGRDRRLSLSDVGNPNEMLFIVEGANDSTPEAINLHNYDYDGYLTVGKLKLLLTFFAEND